MVIAKSGLDENGASGLAVYLNDPENPGENWTENKIYLPECESPDMVKVGDINGDSKDDLIFICKNSKQLGWLTIDGQTTCP